MKHITYLPAVALAASMVAGSVSATTIGGGAITFIGTITDNTCSVEGGAGTGGGLDDFAVTLDPVKAFNLDQAGKVAATKEFKVVVGAPGQGTCQNGKVASMYFLNESPDVVAETGNLANKLPEDEETNVQVQLLDDKRQVINLTSARAGLQNVTIANNTAEMTYYAQYYATGPATSGLLETAVLYAVDYN
ncbi:type 1 fimbrial protein [Dyella monticola]|uniref:Type 1 fimbrial protein n=1 Tax=Dyella monticola TaxID=1927958 RepID=A0A370X328_9GAMM|nr:fimbrial protein [Dyella monticola]RDS82799.1 type 1 fimbrial protein [Dyella monticola]